MERTSLCPPFRPQLIELVQVLLGKSSVVNYDNVLIVLGICGFGEVERSCSHPCYVYHDKNGALILLPAPTVSERGYSRQSLSSSSLRPTAVKSLSNRTFNINRLRLSYKLLVLYTILEAYEIPP